MCCFRVRLFTVTSYQIFNIFTSKNVNYLLYTSYQLRFAKKYLVCKIDILIRANTSASFNTVLGATLTPAGFITW